MSEKLEREREGKALGGELVMDTPERGRITTPLSKFEDSPVFNYINNLSPLETARPVRISQTFNSYNLSSVPSVFTSPHVSSLKESKILTRCSDSGPPNPISSENGNKIRSNENFVVCAHTSEIQKEIFNSEDCVANTLNKINAENEAQENQIYDNTVNNNDIDVKCVTSEVGGSSNSLVIFSQQEQNKEEGIFDWGGISDTADFLVFESPDTGDSFKGSFLKPLDSESRLVVSKESQDDGFVGAEVNETENILVQSDEKQINAIGEGGDVVAIACLNNKVTEVSNEVVTHESACNLPRGIRRRCLVYDIGGTRRNFLNDGSTSSSSILSNSNNNNSRCIVPGIGLHLNALARNSKNYMINNQETLATPRQLINDLSSSAASDNFLNNQETINQSLALTSVDRDGISVDGGVRVNENAYELSVYVDNDDLNQSSPKNKKRKVENGGEMEGCKRCNCKKSKCLKLYCECFAAGVYCVEPCSCQECFNKPIHEDIVLTTRKQIESRNPLAFAPKVIRTTDFVPETADDLSTTPASARHKRGCNCKKSGCLKKYCECFQGGVGCSINCRCEGCKNTFGRKEGSYIVLAETELEEAEKHENRNLSKHIFQNKSEPNPDSALPETPMHSNRAPIQHPFSSKNKPPRSLLSTGSSSSSTHYSGRKFGIPAFLQPHMEIEKRIIINSENEIPEILRSPISGIKTCSPKSKRVSSPHGNFESSLSPALKSSRKLILQSIPSFPSLKD